MCISLCVSVCVCVYISLCVPVCVCVCIQLRVSVCVCATRALQRPLQVLHTAQDGGPEGSGLDPGRKFPPASRCVWKSEEDREAGFRESATRDLRFLSRLTPLSRLGSWSPAPAHARRGPASSHLHLEEHRGAPGQLAPPVHGHQRPQQPPPAPGGSPPSRLLLLLPSQGSRQPPHLLLQHLPVGQPSQELLLLLAEHAQTAVGVSQSAGEQPGGGQEGRGLPAPPAEVGGERGEAVLQGGGAVTRGSTFRATRLRMRR